MHRRQPQCIEDSPNASKTGKWNVFEPGTKPRISEPLGPNDQLIGSHTWQLARPKNFYGGCDRTGYVSFRDMVNQVASLARAEREVDFRQVP